MLQVAQIADDGVVVIPIVQPLGERRRDELAAAIVFGPGAHALAKMFGVHGQKAIGSEDGRSPTERTQA